MNLNLACRQVLMSAYLYYKRDHPVLTDFQNDHLVRDVIACWDNIDPRYIPLLDPDNQGKHSIEATTYHCKYTRLVEGGALIWLQAERGIILPPLNYGYYEAGLSSCSSVDDLLL